MQDKGRPSGVSVAVVLLPAIIMSIGELATVPVSKRMQAVSQNLSAGLILGSLSSEITPMVSSLVATHEHGALRYLCLASILLGGILSLGANFSISMWADQAADGEGGADEAIPTQLCSPASRMFRACFGAEVAQAAREFEGALLHSPNDRGGNYSSIEEPINDTTRQGQRQAQLQQLEWESTGAAVALEGADVGVSETTKENARELLASVSLKASSLPEAVRHRGSFDFVLHGLERDGTSIFAQPVSAFEPGVLIVCLLSSHRLDFFFIMPLQFTSCFEP